ncbi:MULTISPECIES: hypothetical protein [unclassified Burkholderia]|uniref:hypothetical protein n=1 Tax=unclassified Burkholderia TaxID=2613784 RepID=UPI000F589257|nr:MULTISPECIES: hypothetical protein [unclassified Burkholderia]
MVHRLDSVGTVEGWQADAPIRGADMPPGFCLKNIGMKLLKKFRCACRAECGAARRMPTGAQRPE